MPNEITIKIKVENDSAKGFEETLAEAKAFGAKLKEELDRAGKDAGQKAADEIKHQLEELNPPAIDVKVDTEEAKVEIQEVKDDLHGLDNDDASIKIKIKEENVKSETGKVKSELKKGLEEAGTEGGNGFSNALKNGLSKIDFQPTLVSSLVGLGVVLSPLIGGVIAAAVVGSVGLGGIVGGVIIAAHNPQVKSAFQGMKKDLGDALKLDAAPFVPVVVTAIGAIQKAVRSIDLAGIFKDLAPQVAPLLGGVLSMITSLAQSFKQITATSGPVIKELGDDFRGLGSTLGNAFASLSDNSKQEAAALHDLFSVVDTTITAVFGLVNALTEVYGAFHRVEAFTGIATNAFSKAHGQMRELTSAEVAAAAANNGLADSDKVAADAASAHAEQIRGLSDALKAQTDPTFALIDAQKQVNTATNAYNKAVKTSGTNSKAARDAQVALEKATVGYISAAALAAGGTGKLTDQQKALLKSAGASAATIRGLERDLKNAYNAAKKLDGFRVTVSVGYSYATFNKPRSSISPYDYHGLATGGVKGAANGATSSGLTWVGENGPELADLPAGTSVKSAGDSKRMSQGMDGAGGAMIVQLHVDGRVIAQAMVDPTRKFVQQNFGGNVQKAYGVGA